MPSRRSQIQLTQEEATTFLAEQTVANVATIGPNGRPHLAPLWYVPRPTLHPAALATWTFGRSQKVSNLRRLPQATVLVEAGESYEQLRGLSLECDVEILTELDTVTAIGRELTERYTPGIGGAADSFVAVQAPKRVGLVFLPTRILSWDHRKLGGTY
ncbi:MAG: pyridoxamine 5'-phosphate oxidase family protein [Sciscionella sp.]